MITETITFAVRTEKNLHGFDATITDESYMEIETNQGCRLYEAPKLLRQLAEAIEKRFPEIVDAEVCSKYLKEAA